MQDFRAIWIIFAEILMKRLLSFIFVSAVLASCLGTEYYDVASEKLSADELVQQQGIIPQEGTVLTLDLTHEYEYYTRFQPGREAKKYRYRVLIDGHLYCQDVLYMFDPSVSIPIMANDSYSLKSIVVEGAKALEYGDEPDWEDWHELYSAAQEAMGTGQPLKYSGLMGSSLQIELEGKTLNLDFEENGSAEVFRRILSERQGCYISSSSNVSDTFAYIDYHREETDEGLLITEMWDRVPQNTVYSKFLAGTLYYSDWSLLLSLHDYNYGGLCGGKSYLTPIATVRKEDMKTLRSLYRNHQFLDTEIAIRLVP